MPQLALGVPPPKTQIAAPNRAASQAPQCVHMCAPARVNMRAQYSLNAREAVPHPLRDSARMAIISGRTPPSDRNPGSDLSRAGRPVKRWITSVPEAVVEEFGCQEGRVSAVDSCRQRCCRRASTDSSTVALLATTSRRSRCPWGGRRDRKQVAVAAKSFGHRPPSMTAFGSCSPLGRSPPGSTRPPARRLRPRHRQLPAALPAGTPHRGSARHLRDLDQGRTTRMMKSVAASCAGDLP